MTVFRSAIFIVTLVLFSGLLTNRSAAEITLQQAIRLTLQRNPKTKSKDMQIEALKERTRAAWAAFLPTASLSCTYGQTSANSNASGTYLDTRTRNQGCSVGVNINLYRGGSDYYNAMAAESTALGQEDVFNSTSTLINNTRGAVAAQTVSIYSNLMLFDTELEYYAYERKALEKFLTAAKTDEDRVRVQATIDNVDANIKSIMASIEVARSDFEFVVTVPAPPEVERFDSAIAGMVIPDTREEALEIAQEQSPDLKATDHFLDASRYRAKGQKADLFGPRIDLSLVKNHGRFDNRMDPFNSSYSSSGMVQITIQASLSAPKFFGHTAAQDEVIAAELERDAALKDLMQKIIKLYANNATYNKLEVLYRRQFQDSRAVIDDILRRIDQGGEINMEYALGRFSTHGANFSNLLQNELNLLSGRFSVQQIIGTLFRQLGLN